MRNESLFPHKHPVPMSAGGYDKTIHIMKPGDYGAHRSALGEAPPAFVAEDSVARSVASIEARPRTGACRECYTRGYGNPSSPTTGTPQASADRASRQGPGSGAG